MEDYIAQRAPHVNAKLGYRQLVNWSQDLKLEELEKVSFIVEGEKDKKERKLQRFNCLEWKERLCWGGI